MARLAALLMLVCGLALADPLSGPAIDAETLAKAPADPAQLKKLDGHAAGVREASAFAASAGLRAVRVDAPAP